MPALGFYSRTYRDYDSEESNIRVRVEEMTAVNFAAQLALSVTFASALNAMQGGAIARYSLGNSYEISPLPASSPTAQRESKWLVQYVGTDGKSYTMEIPNALHSLLDANDRAHAEIGDAGVVDAFIAAFEAYVLDEAGTAVTVQEITLVGRNT